MAEPRQRDGQDKKPGSVPRQILGVRQTASATADARLRVDHSAPDRPLPEDEEWDPEWADSEDELEADYLPAARDAGADRLTAATALQLAIDTIVREGGPNPDAAAALTEFYRTGALTPDAPGACAAAVTEADPSDGWPGPATFAVEAEGDAVWVTVPESLFDAAGVPTSSQATRVRMLDDIAREVLVGVQSRFFTAPDPAAAARRLLPVEPEWVRDILRGAMPKATADTLDPIISELGQLTVAGPLGDFPLNTFLPALGTVAYLWLDVAFARPADELPKKTPKPLLTWLTGEWQRCGLLAAVPAESPWRTAARGLLGGVTHENVRYWVKQRKAKVSGGVKAKVGKGEM